jgi:hypothetical protein
VATASTPVVINDFGWKSLQLLKSQGRWKIASEIYTVRDLPTQQSEGAPAR